MLLEERWQQIEQLNQTCSACGGRAFQRGGQIALTRVDQEVRPDANLSGIVDALLGPVSLERVCSVCGHVALFRFDL